MRFVRAFLAVKALLFARAAVLALKALLRGPGLDQSSVYCEVFIRTYGWASFNTR